MIQRARIDVEGAGAGLAGPGDDERQLVPATVGVTLTPLNYARSERRRGARDPRRAAISHRVDR